MDNIREFIKKYKIGLTIILFLVASFFVFLFVRADEDVYENQITVSNPRVNIIDGTANVDGNFDANDEDGNDSSASNKIVRNFDTLTYEISYDLAYKEDSTLEEEEKTLDNTRDVIADILIPASLSVDVSESDYMNLLTPEMTIESNGVLYNYYKAEIKDASMAQTNTFDIVLSNINGKNNDIISPIIRVREATENTQAVSPLMNVSEIAKLQIPDVKISAKEKYGVKLYQGVIKKDDENINSQLPVGIAIYIPNDQNRGIRGIQIPSELAFNFNINTSTPSEQSTVLSATQLNNYSEDSGYVVMDLPYSYSNNNGNAAVEAENYLNQNGQSSFKIKFSDLKYNNGTIQTSETETGYYLSTKVFVFSNQRAAGYKSDITYTITTDAQITNTINDYLDNYKPFIGDYTSKIDFFNRAVSSDSELSFVESGKAIYNYNEEFYIQNTINYGTKKGDKLEHGYTNYIKIDNTAFKLEDVGNVSDESKDYYIQFSNDSNTNISESVQYGLGEWTPSYFKLKANRPSYCPNALTGVSKEALMNMYGGPCIEDNDIRWVDSLQDAADQNKDDKVIIFKLNVSSEYPTGVQTVVRLKAKAVKNYSNIGNTFEIVSRGKTTHNGADYYLSEIPKVSVSNQTQDLSYTKTTYDNDYNVSQLHKSTGNGTDLTTNIGNTVLVSAFKTSINSISLFDAYGSEKTSFYSGMTDPIEFVVNPIIYKSDYDATITSAKISVYLPEQLEIYEKSSDKKYNAQTSGQIETIDGVNYKVYNYEYSESDINFENESASGTIPSFLRIIILYRSSLFFSILLYKKSSP